LLLDLYISISVGIVVPNFIPIEPHRRRYDVKMATMESQIDFRLRD